MGHTFYQFNYTSKIKVSGADGRHGKHCFQSLVLKGMFCSFAAKLYASHNLAKQRCVFFNTKN
jgi:hypothetical protein